MTTVIGRRVVRKEEVTSTNDLAKAFGKEGEEQGIIFLATRQTEGRGRIGRQWSSPEGGLYLSILLRPELRSREILRLTVLVSVPVAEAIEEVTGLKARVKWPNDIIIAGRKVGGILVEGVSKGRRIDFVVVGIGINVNTPLREIRAEGATSLLHELGTAVSMERLFHSIVAHLEMFYRELLTNEFDESKYTHLSTVLGHEIEATVGKERFKGKALRLAPNGALVMKSETGIVLRMSHVHETSIKVTNSEEMDDER